MPYGYAGALLRIDVTNKSVVAESLSPEVLHDWVGGTGLGVKYIYDEVPPSATWDDPENRILVSAGALSGTGGIGSGAVGVVTKGAMTGGIATSQANGFLGTFLKYCGYDSILIQGKSSEWVYIYIDEDKVEIKSASHLMGLDTTETEEKLHEEYQLKPSQLSVYSIGPAGENLVKFACWIGDDGHVAAHNGIGAVFGSKRVKAIAVKRGKKKPQVFDSEALRKSATEIHRVCKEGPVGSGTSKWGTNVAAGMAAKAGMSPVKNLTTSIVDEGHDAYVADKLRSGIFEYKKKPCWGCNWSHCGVTKIISGPYAGLVTDEPEYEAMSEMGGQLGIHDPAQSMVLSNLVDRLGFDVNEMGWVIGWVLECYEKGYLTLQELDGLEMTWGNFENIRTLITKIAHRDGIGDFLAEGTMRCAKKMGSPALECGVFTEKGNSPRGHDHRVMWVELLDCCTSSTGTVEAVAGFFNLGRYNMKPIDQFSADEVADYNATINGERLFEDSLGICRFYCDDPVLTCEALNATTGNNYTFEEMMKIGKRMANVMRIYNLKCGITSETDKPSPRYGSPILDGPAFERFSPSIGEQFEHMKERYYQGMGWDKKGVPLPETLETLGLSDLISELY